MLTVCVYVDIRMGVWRYSSTHFWLGTRQTWVVSCTFRPHYFV